MAVAWVVVAALVAVARAQIESPFQTKYSQLPGAYSPKPVFLSDQASPVIYQTPQGLALAKSPISALFPQHLNAKRINAPVLKSFNPDCPNCPYISPPSLEDAVAIQVIPQSPSFVIPEGPNSRFINPASPLAALAVLDDGTPVAVIPAAAKSPAFALNPQGSRKIIPPQQAIPQNPNAQPATVFLEDGSPITVVPVQSKPLQPSAFTAIPQEPSVRFVNPQQFFAPNPNAQPATVENRFLEESAPITVVPVRSKTLQPSAFTAIPQEPSVRLVRPQKFLAPNPNALPSAYFLEDESPISVVPVAKNIQPSQPLVGRCPPYGGPCPTLLGAPSTPLVPLN